MNLKELREEAWDIARDTATSDTDRLWRKAEMNRYINRVYRRIARETRCIRDASPSSLTRISVAPPTSYDGVETTSLTNLAAADTPQAPYYAEDVVAYNNPNNWLYQKLVAPNVYPLDPLIIDIDEVKWTDKQWRLMKVSVKKWQVNPYWEQIPGMPTEYATDYSNNTLAINFRADTSDTLRLQIRRMPLTDLVLDTDVPEYRSHYHDFMINGVLWQMYSKQDAETNDPVKMAYYEAKFKEDIDEIKQQEVILDQMLKCNFSIDAFR